MPKLARGEANACMAAAIVLDAFAGRKLERQIFQFEYAKAMMEQVSEFIICCEDKTSRTYGDLAKLEWEVFQSLDVTHNFSRLQNLLDIALVIPVPTSASLP